MNLIIRRKMTPKEATKLVAHGFALSARDGLNFIQKDSVRIEITKLQLGRITAAINRVLFENKLKITRKEVISAKKTEEAAEKRAVVSGLTLSKTVALSMVISKGYEWSKNHATITNGHLTFFVK